MKQSLSKKFENFWYYYKWHTLAGLFVLFVVIVTLNQCATKVNPDVSVMVLTGSETVTDTQSTVLEAALESRVGDYNGNGKRQVQIDNIDLTGGGDASIAAAMNQKMAADLSIADDILLIMDKSALNRMRKAGVLDKIASVAPGTKSADGYGVPLSGIRLFQGSASSAGAKLYLGIRRYKGTDIESASNLAYYKENVSFLKKILTASPYRAPSAG